MHETDYHEPLGWTGALIEPGNGIFRSCMSGTAEDPTRSFAWAPVSPDQPRLLVFWEGGSRSVPLEAGTSLVLGRGDGCDLQVLHPSVSRRHLRCHAGPPIRIEDLGSSRGTRVDGGLIGTAPVAVEPGQIIEAGGAIVIVQAAPGATPNPPALGSTPDAPSPEAAAIDLDRLVTLVARSNLSVLVVGETGAGKEVMAERIHRTSARASGPFLKLNCAAFPQALLESELFGHEKGAFTGAVHAKLGLIESAERGTVLLDEIGEMPLDVQAKLLRTLESREVRRIGALRPVTVDVRFLAATHRDLAQLVSEGRFRQDLLFRLNGVTIPVSPLRARPGRILTLAKEMLNGAPLTAAAEAALLHYSWPGNVRELRNVIERARVLADGRPIDVPHLLLDAPAPLSAAPAPSLPAKLEDYEREQVIRALHEHNGNQTRAAAALGISRRALINRIEAYNLPRPRKG